jgi:DNA-binding response OmpR family regulator
MGMNIMVVDDEQSIADLIEVYLKMKVKQCTNFITVSMR